MKIPLIPLIVLGALALIFFYLDWKKNRYSKDLVFPTPIVKRPDLKYCYYSSMFEQVAETKGHINMHMDSQMDGPEKCNQNILDSGVDCILNVEYQVFSPYVPGEHRWVREDAGPRLADFFSKLRATGALSHIKILYPIDEPNNTVGSATELAKAIAVIRGVADVFNELSGYKLAALYAADKPFICQELLDFVGFDDYDMKSHVLVSDKYKALKASLLPHQKTIIVPGGCYGQDPVPFINFAQLNYEVGIVMPFLWYDDPHGNAGATGIRSGSMQQAYIDAGKSVIQ